MLDFLVFALCAPYSETTHGHQFDILLQLVSGKARHLYRIFDYGPAALALQKSAGLITRAIIQVHNRMPNFVNIVKIKLCNFCFQEAVDDVESRRLQELALTSGALLRSFY